MKVTLRIVLIPFFENITNYGNKKEYIFEREENIRLEPIPTHIQMDENFYMKIDEIIFSIKENKYILVRRIDNSDLYSNQQINDKNEELEKKSIKNQIKLFKENGFKEI